VAAAELGRRVPKDLLIASCVNSPALRACSPAITALDLRPAEVGRLSVPGRALECGAPW
jgi:DNA-binding LacI/PurR family transcriptional regulator